MIKMVLPTGDLLLPGRWLVGWLIGFIIIDQGFERTRQQSQNVYKNRDSCLVDG